MPSILQELYFGNIRPDSGIHSQNSPYAKAARLRYSNYEQLLAMLNEPEKEQLEKYLDAAGELEGTRLYDTFTYAFKFGALLMLEVLAGSGQVTGESKIE